MKLMEARVALRTVFRAPVRISTEFDRLIGSISDLREAAVETRRNLSGSASIRAVIACTDDAGDFSR